jgi:hypothetical protein
MTTKAELERATERVVNVCRGLQTPDDAFDVLGVAFQMIACMSEPDKLAVLARVNNVMRQLRKEMADNYDRYMAGIGEAHERQLQWEKAAKGMAECLVQWLDAEPEDKTKH